MLWVGVASVLALLYMVNKAIQAVGSGKALDTYHTHWLVEGRWITLLVFVAIAVAALGVGVWLRYRELRELKRLERKFSPPRSDA